MSGQIRMKTWCALLGVLSLMWCGALTGVQTTAFAQNAAAQKASTSNAPAFFEAVPQNAARDLNRAQKQRLGELARVRLFNVQLGALAAHERLQLQLLGTTVVAQRSELQNDADGVLWQGAIVGDKYSSVTLSERKGRVRGLIYSAAGNFIVEPLQDKTAGLVAARAGDQVLVALGEVERRNLGNDMVFPPQNNFAPRSPYTARAGEDGNTIDMLVVYDRIAAQKAPDVEATIQLAIDDANKRFANSNTVARVRLVRTQMIEYDSSGSLATDLTRLQNPGDGFADEVAGLRDFYGADLVFMVCGANDPAFGGLAYVMNNVGPGFESFAFGTVTLRDLVFAFAHEIGHNLGSGHDHITDPNAKPAYPYAFGHTNAAKGFYTTMSYPTECINLKVPCRDLPLFSNPDLQFNDAPIGVPEGQTNAADNRKTFATTAGVAAAFRQSRASISGEDFSAPEGNEGTNTFAIPIRRTQPLGKTLSIPYRFEFGTAKTGLDYDATSGEVTFLPNQDTATINVPIVTDSKFEQDETFTLIVGTEDSTQILNPIRITITIANDDLPQVSISNASIVEGNTLNTPRLPFLIFDVQLDGPFNTPLSVDYKTVNGTASADDYTAQSGTVTFPAGETVAAITVAVTPDIRVEADETVIVQLSNPVGVALVSESATGTIINDDLPGLRAEDIKVREGGVATFSVRLLQPSASEVKVRYNLANGTAAAPADFQPGSGVLTFAPGQTVQQVRVQTADDNTIEDDEFFALRFTGVLGATVETPTVRATIVDNERRSVVQIDNARIVEGNEGQSNLVFAVRLSDASLADISFRYQTQDDSATAGSDYVKTSGIFRLGVGQTGGSIEVPIKGDREIEGNETFRLVFSDAKNVRLSKEFASGLILTDDIDRTPPSLQLDGIAPGQAFRELPQFSGKAADESALNGVVLQLQRVSDGAVFDGTAFVRPKPGLTLATTMRLVGKLPSGIGQVATFVVAKSLPTGDVVEEGEYLVLATAGDTSGLRGEVRANFTIDRTPPELSIISPADRRVLQGLNSIAGRVSDEVAGVASVEVTLRRNGDGAFYDGVAFGADRALLPTKIQNTTWILATPLPRFTDGSYTITAIATDRAGNTTTVTNVVTFSGVSAPTARLQTERTPRLALL